MKNITEEINKLNSIIKQKQQLIINLSKSNKEKKQELIARINNDILTLKRKVSILTEKQNKGIYIPQKPELGDQRYKKLVHKEALDILRVLYYDIFHKDPSISFISYNKALFIDDTLPVYGTAYLIRGEIPFEIMLQTQYKDYTPSEEHSVGIIIDKKNLLNKNTNEYFYLISTLITKYTHNEINFICGDHSDSNYTLAYIADQDFNHYKDTLNEKMFYDFFNLLCDNNVRNIIYIGNTMKQNARLDEIEKVYSNFVIPDMKFIADELRIPFENLQKSNEHIKKLILQPKIK